MRFDIAKAVVLAKTALNAKRELTELLAEVGGKLTSEDEAELVQVRLQLHESNQALYNEVDAKLAAASQKPPLA